MTDGSRPQINWKMSAPPGKQEWPSVSKENYLYLSQVNVVKSPWEDRLCLSETSAGRRPQCPSMIAGEPNLLAVPDVRERKTDFLPVRVRSVFPEVNEHHRSGEPRWG